MIEILIVEDEDPKRKHIEKYIRKKMQFSNIRVAKSVTSAISNIDELLPDLLLLDMSLPTFDIGKHEGGGRPQGFGGVELLRYMDISEYKCSIIVITGYEAFPKGTSQVDLSDLKCQIDDEFGSLISGVVHFNSSIDDWKSQLDGILDQLGITS